MKHKLLRSSDIHAIIMIIEAQHNVKGSFFSATNVLKNGDERKWSARLGVQKHLSGAGPAYDPESRNFITVWDPNAKGNHKYRQLNVSTLIRLQVCGEVVVRNSKPTSIYYKHIDAARAMVKLRKG